MDPSVPAELLAARSQMAFTLGFHIVLACLGVGLPTHRPDRKRDRPSARGSSGAPARAAMVDRDGRDLCRWRRDRDGAVVRDGPALAGPHGPLRRCLRDPVRDRGAVLLPRGDLHRDLHLRLATSLARTPSPVGAAGRAGGDRGNVLRGRREQLDEPAIGLRGRRHGKGRRGRSHRGHLQPGDLVRGPAYVPRGLHGHGLPARFRLRRRAAPRTRGSVRAPWVRHPIRDRGDRRAGPGHGRRRRCARRAGGSARQVRVHGARRHDRTPSAGDHRRHSRRRPGRRGHRHPVARVDHRRLLARHGDHRARRHPARRAPAGDDRPPRLGHDGRDRDRTRRARRVGADPAPAAARLRDLPMVPARFGAVGVGGDPRPRGRLDRHRGRAPTMGRLRLPADRRRGYPRFGGQVHLDRRHRPVLGARYRDAGRPARAQAPVGDPGRECRRGGRAFDGLAPEDDVPYGPTRRSGEDPQ